MCSAAATSSCARDRTRDYGCLSFGAEIVAHNVHVCDHTDVTQTLILALQIWEPPEVPHLCHAAATSSCARGRARECGCLAFGAEVAARIAHVCDHADVTQTFVPAPQIHRPPEVPDLCRAAATSSCARGRTRECGCLALGAEAVARSARAGDHTDVTKTLILSLQIWALPEVPHLCRAIATSSCARGRARECGCLAFGAEVVARSACGFDNADVTQTLILAFQL